MYHRGVAFGVAFCFFFFCFQPHKLPKIGQKQGFLRVFKGQNNNAHRIRGALLSVNLYKIATYRVLGCFKTYISEEFADTAKHFIYFDDAAFLKFLFIIVCCVDRNKKEFVRVFRLAENLNCADGVHYYSVNLAISSRVHSLRAIISP